jgi:hypothetical protein
MQLIKIFFENYFCHLDIEVIYKTKMNFKQTGKSLSLTYPYFLTHPRCNFVVIKTSFDKNCISEPFYVVFASRP